jgi:HlyD family secretion protein
MALGIEEQRVNVIIGFSQRAAEKAARLGHGYQIDATIILWSSKDVLRVPIGALFRGADGAWNAFVVEGGRARQRKLTIGHLNDEFGEVVDGLEEGDTIVMNPGNSLEDGARIAVR